MRVIGSLSLVLAAACAGNAASTGAAPSTEYICAGRDSDGDVRERIHANSRGGPNATFQANETDITDDKPHPDPQ